jgi:cell division protein FtsL
MGWVILILLLLAAAFGVLGAVLKAAVFIVLTVLLSITLLAAIGWYALKHQARKLTAEFDARSAERREEQQRRDGSELPPPRDDRY